MQGLRFSGKMKGVFFMKKFLAMIICLVMAFSVGALAERGMGGGPNGGDPRGSGMGGPGGMGGMT